MIKSLGINNRYLMPVSTNNLAILLMTKFPHQLPKNKITIEQNEVHVWMTKPQDIVDEQLL